ncbi:MAG: hypothetical protein JF606_19670 [Burkholderiales bacterium]|nr:hypothetical protein [Burkholderiales bacterium]
MAKGSFPASHLVGLAPEATARWSPKGWRTGLGTHRYQIRQRLVLRWTASTSMAGQDHCRAPLRDVAGMVRYAIRRDLVQPVV